MFNGEVIWQANDSYADTDKKLDRNAEKEEIDIKKVDHVRLEFYLILKQGFDKGKT